MMNTDKSLIDKIFISRLAKSAKSLFGVSLSMSNRIATKFIKDKSVKMDDPLLNHSGIESYTVPMLLKYHVFNKKQLSQKVN